jgi:hypothetical protein
LKISQMIQKKEKTGTGYQLFLFYVSLQYVVLEFCFFEHFRPRGGHTRLRGRWWGGPNSDDGTETLIVYVMYTTSVADPGSGAFLTHGSGIQERKSHGPDPGPGWTTRIIFPRALKPFFWVKILKFFDADPGSGMKKVGSGICNLQHCILQSLYAWGTVPIPFPVEAPTLFRLYRGRDYAILIIPCARPRSLDNTVGAIQISPWARLRYSHFIIGARVFSLFSLYRTLFCFRSHFFVFVHTKDPHYLLKKFIRVPGTLQSANLFLCKNSSNTVQRFPYRKIWFTAVQGDENAFSPCIRVSE